MKHILRIGLVVILMAAMLLYVTPLYADPGDESPADPPSGEDPPEDPGLNVDIAIVGDNPDVNIDIFGEDAEVTVNTTGTDIYLNGQNINEPTVIHEGGGVSGGWVKSKINQIVEPLYSFAGEAQAKISLFADGLAKVILLAQGNESELEASFSQLGDHSERLTTLESETASLGEQVDALEAQDAAITARVNYLTAYYNRILLIIIGAFSVVVIGLGVSLYLTRRRVS